MRQTRTNPPQALSGPRRMPIPARARRLLLEALDRAREEECDPWQFAVAIQPLRSAGLTDTQLRWLLRQGQVAQRLERTRPQDPRRRFQRLANLSLPEGACFLLTEAGAAWARNGRGSRGNRSGDTGPRTKPVWDRAEGELRVGRVVVKRVPPRAGTQILLLDSLQEQGWARRIDDPLPPRPGQNPKKRLHSAISNLNRNQLTKRIQFSGGGDGQTICWRLLSPTGES
jgi:hypothetical protein